MSRPVAPAPAPVTDPVRSKSVADVATPTVTSYRCDGCGATLQSVEELDKEVGTATRSWFCAYCGVSVPSRVAELIQHREDGSATDRRP